MRQLLYLLPAPDVPQDLMASLELDLPAEYATHETLPSVDDGFERPSIEEPADGVLEAAWAAVPDDDDWSALLVVVISHDYGSVLEEMEAG